MSDETVTKWRCSHCQQTFEDPYQADKHRDETDAETIREIEVEPTPATSATSLTEWGNDE